MHIPSYQIHNVLKLYANQLSQSKLSEQENLSSGEMTIESFSISAEGKRRAIIEKVATDIVQRITCFGPAEDPGDEASQGWRDEDDAQANDVPSKQMRFVFNVIDASNQKLTTTLSVEDSSFLLKRLEQSVREAVDRKLDS
jgi:hypothetical protein